MLDYFPQFFTNKAITLYLLSLIVVSVLFFNNSLPIAWWFFGIVEVISFFYFSNVLTKKWSNISEKSFRKKLFTTALMIRIVWVIVSYILFLTVWTGTPFEWHYGDSGAYHELGYWVSYLIKNGEIQQYFDYFEGRYSDSGYAAFLGIQYVLTGDSIFIARLLKALFSALTALMVYKLTSRTFNESTGRMAGIFTMLMPSLIYYTGLHLKETEMVFISVWFLERADSLLRSRNFSFSTLWLPIVLVVVLFFFRTVLAVTILFAFFTAIFFTSERILKIGKRLIIGIWVVLAIGFLFGTKYVNEISEIWNQRGESQAQSINWRATREGGNILAVYASTAVFVPLILVIPFPTMVNINGQEIQMFMNGGNFVKNIIAFFVIFAIYWIIKEKKWRDFLLIITFLVGYLAVLAMSAFAQSERFHQPIIPMLLILAALGISKITDKQKKLFNIYLFVVFAIIIGWNLFKLSGRGLI